jgi:hypothetical protein
MLNPRLGQRQCKAYRAILTQLGFNPYPPTVDLDDTLDYAQACTCPLALSVHLVEEAEELLMLLRVDIPIPSSLTKNTVSSPSFLELISISGLS